MVQYVLKFQYTLLLPAVWQEDTVGTLAVNLAGPGKDTLMHC